MQHLRLTLEYDGTDFVGWQIQPGKRSVQGVLEEAIARLLGGDTVSVSVAGRTDSGVHARGQVVSFRSKKHREPFDWISGLNGVLPFDLAVVDAVEVSENFDPRTWACWKRYVYKIWNGRHRSPLSRPCSWHVPFPLDLEMMGSAAAFFIGEHDFTSFRGAGCGADNAVRVIESLKISGAEGGIVSIEVKGTAFLRYMVRNIVGTLVEVGTGRRSPQDIQALLLARDRSLAGRTAPALGLCLEEVHYEDKPPRRRLMAT